MCFLTKLQHRICISLFPFLFGTENQVIHHITSMFGKNKVNLSQGLPQSITQGSHSPSQHVCPFSRI